jgi:ssDNA-binding Zn-finger/Zn-ribbon topoisomerase 1
MTNYVKRIVGQRCPRCNKKRMLYPSLKNSERFICRECDLVENFDKFFKIDRTSGYAILSTI